MRARGFLLSVSITPLDLSSLLNTSTAIDDRPAGKPHDAGRGKDRGIRARNKVLQAFRERLDIFDASPDPQITSFDLTKYAIDSSR